MNMDNPITRKKTKQITLGTVKIGGGAPVAVQSMCNTDTRDAAKTLEQIGHLEQAGCEIVRLAVPDEEAAKSLGEIRKGTKMPLIADIHFDYRLALEAVKQGVDGLRINPGNIGGRDKVSEVVRACKDRGIPIRIGVNAGSLEKHLLEKYRHPTPEAIVESAFGHIRILEDLNFTNLKVSLKASDVMTTVASYRLFSGEVRLSAAYRHLRSRHALFRYDQVERGARHPACRRHRRHDAGFAHR